MSLKNDDLFVVQRGNTLYKVNSDALKTEYAESTVTVGTNPPTNPAEGTLWWSTLEGNLFIWYDDGDSAQWVDASPAFIELDYVRIENYIDQSVRDNAVAQIIPSGIITVSPSDGKGTVTIGADTTLFDEDQQSQDDRINELERIVLSLADRLNTLEDIVNGIDTIDGGYPNAEGVFDEDDVDGGSADPTSQNEADINGGDAEGYD